MSVHKNSVMEKHFSFLTHIFIYSRETTFAAHENTEKQEHTKLILFNDNADSIVSQKKYRRIKH